MGSLEIDMEGHNPEAGGFCLYLTPNSKRGAGAGDVISITSVSVADPTHDDETVMNAHLSSRVRRRDRAGCREPR